jgi:predicted nucleic acid-binding protein
MGGSVMLDASVFIKHWRTKNKEKSLLEQLTRQYQNIYISAIAKYEVFVGAKEKDMDE